MESNDIRYMRKWTFFATQVHIPKLKYYGGPKVHFFFSSPHPSQGAEKRSQGAEKRSQGAEKRKQGAEKRNCTLGPP